ncbi:MAG: slipin family protein, partial [Coriobacteriia bacterium]|nr:slipin family protein [Coriobacteriia bacterium]
MAKEKRAEPDQIEASIEVDEKRSSGSSEIDTNKTTRHGVHIFSILVLVISYLIAFFATFAWLSLWTAIGSAVFALLCFSSIRITLEWERVAILRFGKFNRIAGPGLFFCIPFIEFVTIRVDQRIKTASLSAEAALTADLVPVDVDAILFWMVWNAKKACLEVDNYPKAVLRSAQTALRDAIGQLNLTDLSVRRQQIDHELEGILGQKCEHWGITVLSVEIRDITIPHDLQNALSKEAQAERERNARIILAEVEKDISEMFVEAAKIYEQQPQAINLRAMNLAYESAREGKGIIL